MSFIFPTLEDCQNATMSCYNNGICSQAINGSYICHCNSLFDKDYSCRVSYYYTWQGLDLIVVIIPLVAFAVWLSLFTADFFFELSKGKKKKLIAMLSPLTKVLAALFCSFRVAYLVIWGVEGIGDYMVTQLYLVSSFMYMFGNLCAVSAYYGVILIWVFVVSGTQEVQEKSTYHFKVASKGIIIGLFIFSPVAFTFYMLIDSFSIMNTLYNAWIAIFLLFGAIWSSYHVVKMHRLLRISRKVLLRVFYKNIYLGVTNILVIVYVLSIVVSLFVKLNQPPWDYLFFNTMWRLLELLIVIFYFLVAESYVVNMMKNKCGEGERNTETRSTLGTGQRMGTDGPSKQ